MVLTAVSNMWTQIYIYAYMTFLIWISKHVFDFVFGTRFCLIFRELFCSCAKKLGRAGCWWSTAELLLCASSSVSHLRTVSFVLLLGVQLGEAPHPALAVLEGAMLSSQERRAGRAASLVP